MYGPTESTTFATRYRIHDVPEGATALPIGRPIPGTEVYLLDAGLRPVPAGVIGEIYLGGAGLARGYWGDPAQTAASFLPLPFGGARGERLYRTGDLGSYQPNGDVSFRGRYDSQIKIRGFRVELEEVETVLRTHPAVGEAVVLPRRKGRGEVELEAYVTGTGEELSRRSLLDFSRRKLPGYMIPADFFVLDALPRSPTGKIDRRALERSRPAEEEGSPASPRSAMEQLVAEVWREVLQRNVGLDDDFFEVGGHSLHVTQITARLRRELGVEVPVRGIFELRTIARLAETLAPAGAGSPLDTSRTSPEVS
jgi:acyl-CoA synthetase (AMP-forming)/AMP-acid ligase II/acyl carrier protein